MDQTKAVVPTTRIVVRIGRGGRDDGGGAIPTLLLRALQEIEQLLPGKDVGGIVVPIGDAPHHAAVWQRRQGAVAADARNLAVHLARAVADVVAVAVCLTLVEAVEPVAVAAAQVRVVHVRVAVDAVPAGNKDAEGAGGRRRGRGCRRWWRRRGGRDQWENRVQQTRHGGVDGRVGGRVAVPEDPLFVLGREGRRYWRDGLAMTQEITMH